jgi:hypothetical protein
LGRFLLRPQGLNVNGLNRRRCLPFIRYRHPRTRLPDSRCFPSVDRFLCRFSRSNSCHGRASSLHHHPRFGLRHRDRHSPHGNCHRVPFVNLRPLAFAHQHLISRAFLLPAPVPAAPQVPGTVAVTTGSTPAAAVATLIITNSRKPRASFSSPLRHRRRPPSSTSLLRQRRNTATLRPEHWAPDLPPSRLANKRHPISRTRAV